MKILIAGVILLGAGVANLADARLAATHDGAPPKNGPSPRRVAAAKRVRDLSDLSLSMSFPPSILDVAESSGRGSEKSEKSSKSSKSGGSSRDGTPMDWCPERRSSPEGIQFSPMQSREQDANPWGKGAVRPKKEDPMLPPKGGKPDIRPPSSLLGKPPPKKKEWPAKKEELPAKKEELPAKKEELLAKKEELPAKKEEFPAKKEERPAKKKEWPAKKEAFDDGDTRKLGRLGVTMGGDVAVPPPFEGPTGSKAASSERGAGLSRARAAAPLGKRDATAARGAPGGRAGGDRARKLEGDGGGMDAAGREPDAIVGGTDVSPPRKYGFFVSMGGCGGSLIAPNLVLTAAHCPVPEFVRLGLHDLTPDSADEFLNTEEIPVKRSIAHPCYDTATPDYDFMILELEHGSRMFREHVVGLDSPDGDGVHMEDGTPLTVMGFGVTLDYFGLDFRPKVMQEVTLSYDSVCGKIPSFGIRESMLCAGDAGLSACFGDSGGPLIDPVTQTVVGVVSFGWAPCGEPGYPGVYSRVSAAYHWIQHIMEEWEEDKARASDAGGCTDSPPGWYDSVGDGCRWYAAELDRCFIYGDGSANVGLTANEVCCACANMEFEDAVEAAAGETSADVSVTFDYDGAYDAMAHGLVYPTVTSYTFPVNDDPRLVRFMVSDAAFLRLAIPAESVELPDDFDLDLSLFDPTGEEVAYSFNYGTDEVVEAVLPMDGIWTLEIYGFYIFSQNSNRFSRDFDLYGWIVPMAPGGNMQVISAPASATVGRKATVSVGWPSSVPGDEWFLGAVSHASNGFLKGLTLIEGENTIEPKTPLLDYPRLRSFSGVVDGEDSLNVTFAYSGSYSAKGHGLEPGALSSGTIAQGDWTKHEVELSGHAYFQVYLPDFLVDSESYSDLDLYLVNPFNQIVAVSQGPGNDEFVEVAFPMDGTWSVYVYAYIEEPSIDYQLLYWKLSATPGGNLNVDGAPTAAVLGSEEYIDISWSAAPIGIGPGFLYVGAISHSDENGPFGLTIVEIDNS